MASMACQSHLGIDSAVTQYYPLWAPTCPHSFVSRNSRATSHELPKDFVLDGGGHVHIRHITPSPLVDVRCYNPPLLRTRRPRRHTRITRQSGSDTKLSHPEIGSIVARYCPLWAPSCPHGFVSGNSQETSQWVTHPGIALPQTRLTSEFS
ncbi:unnamed protein product [Prunus armeniaca]